MALLAGAANKIKQKIGTRNRGVISKPSDAKSACTISPKCQQEADLSRTLRTYHLTSAAQAVGKKIIEFIDFADFSDGRFNIVLDAAKTDGGAIQENVGGTPVGIARLAD